MDIMGEFTAREFGRLPDEEKRTHNDLTALWMSARELMITSATPAAGCVVFYMGFPVCLSGIRVCEGGIGMVDSFVSNPEMSAVVRNKAADCMVEHLIKQAKEMGLSHLIGISKDTNTLVRSLKHGFSVVEGVLVTKDLGVA